MPIILIAHGNRLRRSGATAAWWGWPDAQGVPPDRRRAGRRSRTWQDVSQWGTTLAEASERLGVPKDRLIYLVGEPVEGDTVSPGAARGR